MRCQSELVGGGATFPSRIFLDANKKMLSKPWKLLSSAWAAVSGCLWADFCCCHTPIYPASLVRHIRGSFPPTRRSSLQPISPYISHPSDTAAIATGRPFVLRLCFRICAAIVATSCTEGAIELNLTPVNHLWSFDCHLCLQHWVLLVWPAILRYEKKQEHFLTQKLFSCCAP